MVEDLKRLAFAAWPVLKRKRVVTFVAAAACIAIGGDPGSCLAPVLV